MKAERMPLLFNLADLFHLLVDAVLYLSLIIFVVMIVILLARVVSNISNKDKEENKHKKSLSKPFGVCPLRYGQRLGN